MISERSFHVKIGDTQIESIFTTCFKVWDIRHKDPIFSLTDNVQDYVSSMVTTNDKHYLACTSGEGTVTAININSRKLYAQSEVYEAEFTCAGTLNHDKTLVVGTSNGRFLIYNWGEFGMPVDTFVGPSSKAVNCQVSISDNIVISGWEDGVVRASYLLPNKPLGIVGQHQLSVDALDLSHDGEYVASCSFDQKIRFWHISYFNELDYSSITSKTESNLPSSQFRDRKSFFSDLV